MKQKKKMGRLSTAAIERLHRILKPESQLLMASSIKLQTTDNCIKYRA
jgi:hypothetical protein